MEYSIIVIMLKMKEHKLINANVKNERMLYPKKRRKKDIFVVKYIK